jgi:hypothetical protein
MPFLNGQTIIFGIGPPIFVDVVKSDKYESKVVFTRHPVESGRLNTDHGQTMPDEVEMGITITDTPTADGTFVFQGRARLIYNQLKLWQKIKSPILLVTGVGAFINMRIETLSGGRGSKTGRSIDVDLKFVELLETELNLAARTALGLVDNTIAHTATPIIGLGII